MQRQYTRGRKLTRTEVDELARRAHVEFDPEFLQVRGTWYSPLQLAQAVIAQKKPKGGRPKGMTKATAAKVERVKRLQANGLSLYAISETLKMSYESLRKFVARHRDTLSQ